MYTVTMYHHDGSIIEYEDVVDVEKEANTISIFTDWDEEQIFNYAEFKQISLQGTSEVIEPDDPDDGEGMPEEDEPEEEEFDPLFGLTIQSYGT